MCPVAPRPRHATSVPWPIGPGNVTLLSAGELLVNAPGIGALGPDHVAAGVTAAAAPAPSAQIVPAAATAVASLVMGRLIMLDLAFCLLADCLFYGQAGQGYEQVAEAESRFPH